MKEAEGAGLRELHSLLRELDPASGWGGLARVHTPQGEFLWVCKKHYALYNPPLPVLSAHLDDQARLVRVAAAEGLLRRGVSKLEGAAGQTLARAQDELADSLRTFNDVAADHTTLGSLESARGRDDAASAELTTAVNLDPADPRPHVVLGVIAARRGKFSAALDEFETARKLAPAYPNLARLIDEARKRLPSR